ITPQNPYRTRTHLGFYGLSPNVIHGDAEKLMFADASFDLAFSNGVLHCTPNMEQSFREIYRVLKPHGRFWVSVYYKNSIYNRLTLWLFDYILRGRFRVRSYQEQLSLVEFTTSDDLPLVKVYSRHEFEEILRHSGFKLEATWIRKLVREDLP